MNKTIKFDIVGEVPVEACAQALHLEQSREVTREQHAKGDYTVTKAFQSEVR